MLLSLFEDSILPLNSFILRPALRAIILSLLPGLEDETGEEFERTHAILNRFKAAVGNTNGQNFDDQDISGEQYFWQCLFLASITSSSRRQGALVYLLRNLPRLGKAADQVDSVNTNEQPEQENGYQQSSSQAAEAVSSPEPGLLVRCFATGLRDEHLLIQRGFLDLLVSHLPLHSLVFQGKVTPQDLESLVAAASSVTARREMSLNRRLWLWFLGPDGSTASNTDPVTFETSDGNTARVVPLIPEQSHYFRQYGLGPLVQSILNMTRTESLAPSERVRPFRICLSLMDRWDIGGVVVSEVFLPLMESVWLYQRKAPSQEAFGEVQRSASIFFDAVESGLIWAEIIRILYMNLGEEAAVNTAQNRMELIIFLVTNFNVREEEMQMLHIPLASVVLIICLRKSIQRSFDHPSPDRTALHTIALRTIMHLQDLVPEQAYAQKLPGDHQLILLKDNDYSILESEKCLDSVRQFYERSREFVDRTAPSSSNDNGRLLLQNTVQMVLLHLPKSAQIRYMELELGLFDKITRKTPAAEFLELNSTLSAVMQALGDAPNIAKDDLSITAVSCIVSALETLCTAFSSTLWLSSHKVRQIIPDLVRKVWPWLSPSSPNYNVEAARCIWRLHSISPSSQLIEGAIVTLLVIDDNTREHMRQMEIENARRFATLWAHSPTPPNSGFGALRPCYSCTSRQKSEGKTERVIPQMLLLGRPLLLLLDCLHDTKTQLFAFVTNWLQTLPNNHL